MVLNNRKRTGGESVGGRVLDEEALNIRFPPLFSFWHLGGDDNQVGWRGESKDREVWGGVGEAQRVQEGRGQ